MFVPAGYFHNLRPDGKFELSRLHVCAEVGRSLLQFRANRRSLRIVRSFVRGGGGGGDSVFAEDDIQEPARRGGEVPDAAI